MRITKRHVLASAALVLAVGLIGACGGGSGNDAPEVASLDDEDASTASIPDDTATDDTTPTDPEEAMLAFTECMREHGVDMADPQFGGDGEGGIALEVTPENEGEVEAAQEACQPLLEDAMGDIEIDPEREAEMREQMLEFAECMREHGIDMPDPVFSDDGFVVQEGGPAGDPRDDDDFQAAQEACQPDDAFGPGGAINSVPENEDG
jgi:hypothetical protein